MNGNLDRCEVLGFSTQRMFCGWILARDCTIQRMSLKTTSLENRPTGHTACKHVLERSKAIPAPHHQLTRAVTSKETECQLSMSTASLWVAQRTQPLLLSALVAQSASNQYTGHATIAPNAARCSVPNAWSTQ